MPHAWQRPDRLGVQGDVASEPIRKIETRTTGSMNPYLSFAIAMCAVVIIALAGTAYLSVYFNRRAKGDMERALQRSLAVISMSRKGRSAAGMMGNLPRDVSQPCPVE